MIESDKSWTTEYILNLPICRVRQILELIQQDMRDRAKFQTQVIEWAAKNISSMFVALSDNDKQAKGMQKMVENMHLPLADEQADLIDDRPFEEVVEQGAIIDLEKQPSFEALYVALSSM